MTSQPAPPGHQSVQFDGMSETYSLTNARTRLGELINRVRFGHERIAVTEHGTPVAVIISVEDLADLQATADAADIAAAEAIKARGEEGIPHAQVMAALDALEEAGQAESADEAAAILAPHAALLQRAEEAAGRDYLGP
jgi:prevent-host-death family protein